MRRQLHRPEIVTARHPITKRNASSCLSILLDRKGSTKTRPTTVINPISFIRLFQSKNALIIGIGRFFK
jgi:hypothetical protein